MSVDNAVAPVEKFGANKRTTAQRTADRALIEHWAVRGKTVRQIVEIIAAQRDYRISRNQIQREMKKVAAEWRESYVTERGAAVERELRGLQTQEDELWEAWEKSKLGETTKTNKVRGISATTTGTPEQKQQARDAELSSSTRSSAGDPQFMRLILEVRAQRRALLGLDQPSKMTVSGPDGGKIEVEHKSPDKKFDYAEYERFCTQFFRPPSADGPREPVRAAHAATEAGVLPDGPTN